MKKMFMMNNEKKGRKLNMNEHMAIRFPDRIFQNNKNLFVMVNLKTHVGWNFLIICCHHVLNQTQ